MTRFSRLTVSQPAAKMTDTEKVNGFIVLKSEDGLYYNNKNVAIDKNTGFVDFIGLVKAVCKNDHEGANSNRFWNRLEPEITNADYTIKKDIVYISLKAVEKLVQVNAFNCKKTWNVFLNDGYDRLVKDMKLLQKKCSFSQTSPGSSLPSSSNKKGKSPATDPASANRGTVFKNFAEFTKARANLLNDREKTLNQLETSLIDRVTVLNKREALCTSKEESFAQKEAELKEREARLAKKEREFDTPDVSQFLSQVSSLANKFKAKAARSRRNSSEERQSGSVTPNDSEVDGGEDDKQSSQSKSPSPIPPSGDDEEETADEAEEEVSLF